MLKVREITTSSGKTAIQVVKRENQKTFIVKHIGSAKNSEEKKKLFELANSFIISYERLTPLFPEYLGLVKDKYNLVAVENLTFTKVYRLFSYEFLSYFYELNGFSKIESKFLQDLSIIRILEPVSKLKSIQLIEEYFGKKYSSISIYKRLREVVSLSSSIQNKAVSYAKKYLNFNFTIVFYDVTTLYFETDKDDKFRKFGYSKDGKSAQPQILIALVVNEDGYPVAVEMFEGNKFEGHTILPSIIKFKNRYGIKNLTVVADAAMLSVDNLNELKKYNVNYIVAARLSNLSKEFTEEMVKKLNRKEDVYFRKETDNGILICSYSKRRAIKDRKDRLKQIAKAKKYLESSKTILRKPRFLTEVKESSYALNEELIKKDELMDGIKGYYTNLKDLKDELVIQRYKDLWRIEKAFRIAKSDLLARPIFHFKKQNIKAHILIVFVALCISKSIELQSGLSIQKVKEEILKILDIEFTDKITGKTFIRRMDSSRNPMFHFLEKLKTKHVLKV